MNRNAPGAVQDGKSWGTAFTAVAPAVAAAASGDEVWVAAGVYVEGIALYSAPRLYGGFAGNETARTQRDWKANASILEVSDTVSSSVVSMWVPGVVLDGFTVRNCRMGVWAVNGAATIANCTITGNRTDVAVSNSGVATITGCTISGGVTGVDISDPGTGTITDCTFSGNDEGVIAEGKTEIARCTFADNDVGVIAATGSGTNVSSCAFIGAKDGTTIDGVIVRSGTATVTGCTIVGATYGVLQYQSSSAAITNCILAFNTVGIWHYDGSALTLSHNDVYGNSWANFWNLIDPTGTDGNMSRDPLFVDRANGNLRLLTRSPCIDAGQDSVVSPGALDVEGLPRIVGTHVDMGAYEVQPPKPWSVPLGTSVAGGVVVAEKLAYVAGNDGRLYARYTEDGSAVAGFPVDVSAAVGAQVKLPSRPSVYYGKTGKAIYLTTDRGDVLRILPTGQVAWHVRPLGGQTISTPAVTPTGEVFVNLSTGSGPFNNYLFAQYEATGTPRNISPFLGYTTANDLGDFSPAASGRYLYVNAGWGSRSGLTLLNQDNLTVRSSFAAGEQCLPPLLVGSDLILSSKGGKVWKMNGVTLSPDLGFGHFGVAEVGGQISAAPFADAAGNVYLGTVEGRILKWSPGSAGFQPFTTATGRIAGLTINRQAGVLAFGTSSGSFVQVPLTSPAGAVTVEAGGPVSTGTVYDGVTDRFLVVTDTGVLSGYPSAR